MKDILACPPLALHSTAVVAAFLGKSPSGVRLLVRNGVLKPTHRTSNGMYFSTAVIQHYYDNATQLFKDRKGIPLQKGPTEHEPTED